MSTIAGPAIAVEPAASPRPRSRAGWAPVRVALAVLALAASGAVRLWQERQIETRMKAGGKLAFKLDDLPKSLGPWQAIDAKVLDPEIARGAGSTDSIARTYADDRTGVQLGVLVLYGPALHMHIHAPERCYPAAGYEKTDGPARRVIEYRRPGGETGQATVANLVFAKGEGPAAELKQVCYAWGYDGRWTPDLMGPKYYQRVPGMFKVHIDRRAAPGETLAAENPSESLLRELLPQIEARLRPAATAAAPR